MLKSIVPQCYGVTKALGHFFGIELDITRMHPKSAEPFTYKKIREQSNINIYQMTHIKKTSTYLHRPQIVQSHLNDEETISRYHRCEYR